MDALQTTPLPKPAARLNVFQRPKWECATGWVAIYIHHYLSFAQVMIFNDDIIGKDYDQIMIQDDEVQDTSNKRLLFETTIVS